MSQPAELDLRPDGVAALIRSELAAADSDLAGGTAGAALDAWVRALGLALQMGPSFTRQTLAAILAGAGILAEQRQSDALATIGPALVALVDQVREADALPPIPAMDAWADVVTEVGALVGQVGLAGLLSQAGRASALESVQRRAVLLDEASNSALALGAWINKIARAWAAECHDQAGRDPTSRLCPTT